MSLTLLTSPGSAEVEGRKHPNKKNYLDFNKKQT